MVYWNDAVLAAVEWSKLRGVGRRTETPKVKAFPSSTLLNGSSTLLNGSFSAESTPILTTKKSFCNIFQDLQDLHNSAPLESQKFAKVCKILQDFVRNFLILKKFSQKINVANFQRI